MRIPRSVVGAAVIVLAGFLAAPAAAQAPNAYPVTNVNLRAGPGTQYPVILTVPADAPITILGCLPDYTWCDSVFRNYRGWMRSIYLSGYYEGDYYLLRDYAPDLGYQPVTFNINAYWDSYYRDEPFYGDRGRWEQPYGEGYVNNAVFYDRLSPHGSWTWIQGRYVWVPARVERDWRPYTRGRWVYTNRGWAWVSNEPFGWATYHYGRWGYSDRVGWFWVPGNQWAPAWVSWRQSDDYLAWAPLPPSYDDGYGYDRGSGISINISIGNTPDYYWSMVPSRDFLSDDLSRHYVRDRARRHRDFERTRPIGHTKIVNKTVVNNVVNVNYVEQKTETTVVERQIAATDSVEAAGKVEGDTLEVYEPKADETPEAAAPPEPKDVETVAEASETKDQAEGEATTEDQLAPKEVQEAIKERKGKGRKAKAGAEANVEADAKGEAALPEGELADSPPPVADTKREAVPVPAHEVAAPKDAEPSSKAKEEADTAPKTAPEVTEPGAAEQAAPESDELPAAKPEMTEPDSGPKEKPGAANGKDTGKDADKTKKEKPEAKKPEPKEKSKPKPKPTEESKPEVKEEAKPEPKDEPQPKATETPKQEPAVKEPEAKTPEPDAEKPEVKEPEAKKPEPKAEPEPEAKEPPKPEPKETPKPEPKETPKPEVKKPEAKEPPKPEPKEAPKPEPKEKPKPEVKKPEAKPEPKKEIKAPEAKKPAPKPEKKPEAKKPAPKKLEKPQAKKTEPKTQAKKAAPKPQAKKAAPKKQEAHKPPVKSGPPKREAKKGPPQTKPGGRTAQAPGPNENSPPKKKKKDDDNKTQGR